MRSQNTFLFFITDAQGRSAYWENDAVKWSALPKPLQYSPDGWKDTEPGFTRSNKYFGINRQITTSYKFVEDGASIIRYLHYRAQSYESKVYLIICKWNDETDIYEPYYRGEIDMVKIQDEPATGVSANLIEGDLLKLLNANDDTDFEIPLDGPYLKQVQMEGISLRVKQPYQVLDIDAQFLYLNHVVPFIQLSGDGTAVNLFFNSQQDYEEQIGTDASFYVGSQNFLLKHSENAITPLTVDVTGSIELTMVDSSVNASSYVLYFHTATDDTYGARTTIANHSFTANGETHVFTLNEQVTLQPGQKLFIAGRSLPGALTDPDLRMQFNKTSVRFEALDKYRNTLVKAVAPFDLYTQLLQKVFAGANFTAISTLLQSQYAHLLLTSGDAIRELDAPVLKLSFARFFDNINKILFAGFGINGLNAILESRSTFYNADAVTLDVGEISELGITVAEDQLCNTVKVGYPNQDIEWLNGKFAFNNTNTYNLPIVRVKKEYDQQCSFLSDPYVIEGIRIKFDGQTTTDSKSDNNIFILNTEAKEAIADVSVQWTGAPDFKFILTGQAAAISSFAVGDFFILPAGTDLAGTYSVATATAVSSDLHIVPVERPTITSTTVTTAISFPYQLRRVAYDSVAGVPDDAEIYNVEDLTPKRMLLKHAPYLRSLLHFQTLERIEFNTADRNKELVTELAGTTISEKASVRVDTLGNPLFYPYIFSFKTRVPDTFMSIFNNAINGHIAFRYNGFQLYGFPIQLTAKPDLNEAQEWKLLASPMCDISVLTDLTANPLININMSTYGLSFSKLCPVEFVPQGVVRPDVYNFKHLDTASFADRNQRYMGYRPYCQKWMQSDIISLQCISRNLGPVQVQVLNKYGRVFGTYPLAQVTTPAVGTPYQLFEGDIPLLDLEPGHYQLKCTAGIDTAVVVFLSEVFEVAETWEKTMLFEYSHNRNQAATIFSTGYRPSMRVESWLYDFTPRSRFSTYEDEPANMHLLEAVPYRQYSLYAGDSFGLPDYMIDRLNRIMGLNNVSIDGRAFVRADDAQWEPINRVQGVPGTWWRIEVREAINNDATTLTTDGELNQGVVLINVDTALFGDLTGQVSSNPIQVELLNP